MSILATLLIAFVVFKVIAYVFINSPGLMTGIIMFGYMFFFLLRAVLFILTLPHLITLLIMEGIMYVCSKKK
jgi:hypothetical protein